MMRRKDDFVTEREVTQVTIDGFGKSTTCEQLVSFLEHHIGLGCVLRCRLKAYYPSVDFFPDYQNGTTDLSKRIALPKGHPKAYVHFSSREFACQAFLASQNGELIFKKNQLCVEADKRRTATIPLMFKEAHLDLGILVSQKMFLVNWRARDAQFFLNSFNGTCYFLKTRRIPFIFKDKSGREESVVLSCELKAEFPTESISVVRSYVDEFGVGFLMEFSSCPLLYYRTIDEVVQAVGVDSYTLVDDNDKWIRTTDFTENNSFGRSTSLRVALESKYKAEVSYLIDCLKARRVRVGSLQSQLLIQEEPGVEPIVDLDITFQVRFLLNCLVHRGVVNWYQLGDRFYELLRTQSDEVNISALQHMYAFKPPLDACKKLEEVQGWMRRQRNKTLKRQFTNEDMVKVNSIAITPTRIYCLLPRLEPSNRVFRQYKHKLNRFLRVRFVDEGMEDLNNNCLQYHIPVYHQKTERVMYPSRKTSIFRRVYDYILNGIQVCGLKYSFLLFSPSQLKESSAWFIAEDEEDQFTIQEVTNWMGKFDSRNVANRMARMALCFSATYATVEVPRNQVLLPAPDIERNGYVFSDGIGTIVPDLADRVAKKLKLEKDHIPCAYQIRYDGCKGVIASWPKNDGYLMNLRKSMLKFESLHKTLEVCSWASYKPGYLNREIVTLLSTLGIPDSVFLDMQEKMISHLDRMLLGDREAALDVVNKSHSKQGYVIKMMLNMGFDPKTEPFLNGMLTCLRATKLWSLREKARIFVSEGRWLMGCLDELRKLGHDQCFIKVSVPSSNENKSRFQVIQGKVVITKNPCLHPGDVIVLTAMDIPELSHLTDCLVFPQTGDRPRANEIAGSDLDGDLYFVSWDEKLIPVQRRSPLEYEKQKPKTHLEDIELENIASFFAENVITDNLGVICTAHVVHADRSEVGADDDKCRQLAKLAAEAVDAPKTGRQVFMNQKLQVDMYPDFMCKKASQTYLSSKVLGRLYRETSRPLGLGGGRSDKDFKDMDIEFDWDVYMPGAHSFLEEALKHKRIYDRKMENLIAQYKVSREEEVVTGYVWSLSKVKNKNKENVKEWLKDAYGSLRAEYRAIFEILPSEQLADKEKALKNKAAAWYKVTYDLNMAHKLGVGAGADTKERPIFLSFAWIAADYLCQIKRCSLSRSV